MKVFVGSPVWRQVEFKHYTAMLRFQEYALAQPDVELGFGLVPGDADIARARNVAATHFLNSDADVMLTIDSDIWFAPHDALRICELAMEKDVVGGLYMLRTLRERQPAPLIAPGTEIVMAPGQDPVQVMYLATGFMAVHRRVFEGLLEHPEVELCMKSTSLPWWNFYAQKTIPHEAEGQLYLSEDYAFCHRAREMGFNIWLDPSVRLGHVGQYEYRLEDLITEFPAPQPLHLKQVEGGIQVGTYNLEQVPGDIIVAGV